MRVHAVVPGPEHHGAVRHGLVLARLLADRGVDVTVSRSLGAPAPAGSDLTHVQFTDALLGPDVDAAARRFTAWARQVPRPLVVTLHDVPGQDADPARDARRADGYRRVLGSVDAAVVGSEHEAVGARLVDGLSPVVVPLPVEPLVDPGPRPAWAEGTTVGVLGFVYPGKGHAQALEAVARVARRPTRVLALGGVSPGHEDLLADLRRQADALGVELVVTGPLDEADLHAAALATTVPLADYRTLGSSASLATWLACRRRPVAGDSAQTRELQARWPGSLLVHPAGVEPGLAAALDDPASTWAGGTPPRPDVAGAHLELFGRLVVEPR